jgi:hypothetical protein
MRPFWILRGKTPVAVNDAVEWAGWFKTADRTVAKTKVGDATVSTVFLGLDHGFSGRVLLFETMVFGGEHDGDCTRAATWEEAERQHAHMVNVVRGITFKVYSGGKS